MQPFKLLDQLLCKLMLGFTLNVLKSLKTNSKRVAVTASLVTAPPLAFSLSSAPFLLPLLHSFLHFIDLFPLFSAFLPTSSSHPALLQSKEVNRGRRRGAALPAKQPSAHKALCVHVAHTRMLNLCPSLTVRLHHLTVLRPPRSEMDDIRAKH